MSSELTERQACLVLNALPNIGPITLNRLLKQFGDARAVLAANARRLEAVQGLTPAVGAAINRWPEHFDLQREEARMAAAGTLFVIGGDKAFPPLLKEIGDPPIGLYWKGQSEFDLPCIAVVGSRRTTLYGQNTARKLGAELAQRGFCVVSGLARGIDTAAHEGALSAGGKTVAVLGCGIDIIFPPENLALYRQIELTGAVLSEFPFGRRIDRESFPMRNRVIAGMCEATVVVEADVASGAMRTARFAGEQGRLLFAVPGRIDQPTSAGCHQLIRDGATLLTSVDDIVAELNYLGGRRPSPISPKSGQGASGIGEFSDDEGRVLNCLSGGTKVTRDELMAQTGLHRESLLLILETLERRQLVAVHTDGVVRRLA